MCGMAEATSGGLDNRYASSRRQRIPDPVEGQTLVFSFQDIAFRKATMSSIPRDPLGHNLGTDENKVPKLLILHALIWCPEGDLNPHGLAACGF